LIASNIQEATTKTETIIDKVNRFIIIGRSEFVVEIEYKSCIVVSISTTATPTLRSKASANDSFLSFEKNKIWSLIENFLRKYLFAPSVSASFVNVNDLFAVLICWEITNDFIVLIA
jgi:trehalose-6-phosphate synthase